MRTSSAERKRGLYWRRQPFSQLHPGSLGKDKIFQRQHPTCVPWPMLGSSEQTISISLLIVPSPVPICSSRFVCSCSGLTRTPVTGQNTHLFFGTLLIGNSSGQTVFLTLLHPSFPFSNFLPQSYFPTGLHLPVPGDLQRSCCPFQKTLTDWVGVVKVTNLMSCKDKY